MGMENMIGSNEVAEILGISRPTLAKYIKIGFIVPTKYSVTGRHLFDRDYIQSIKQKLQLSLEDNKEFVSPSQAAKLLGVCPATIGEYERKGLLVVAKRPTAHRKLYSQESVNALLNKGRGNMMTTEELAKEFNCSPALIAFLDAKGMIKCEHKTHTNTKFYDKEAYDKLKEWLEEDEEEV